MELTLDKALQKGIEAHKAGEVQEADRLYTAILKAQPKHPDANHNMGVLGVGVGKVQEALPFFKTALEANPNTVQFWLSYIDALIKLDRLPDAQAALDQVRDNGAKGEAFDGLEQRLEGVEPSETTVSQSQDPPQDQLQPLINLYSQGQFQKALEQASVLLKQFPRAVTLHNIQGAANAGLDQLDAAIDSYKQALSLKPDYAEAYNNIGVALQEQGKLDVAIEAYNKALAIKPDYAEAYNNMGSALKEQGKLEEAMEAYNKAISLKPDYAEVHNNIGIVLQEQGAEKEATEAYKKSIYLKPDYTDAHVNMGINFAERGKVENAIEFYNKALSLKPDHAEAHRNLSIIKKYNADDEQLLQIIKLYQNKDLSSADRCHLSFALAKACEDCGEFKKAFAYLSEGNGLRKKLLGYTSDQDRIIFSYLIKAQPTLKQNSLKITKETCSAVPIFILGMPRSGTTLVEQIISSHSKVIGAGELDFIDRFGRDLALGLSAPNPDDIFNFRISYLSELAKLARGKPFVTDKLPQNFCYIALICAAFPEAKIIHVQRDAAATCWSNYKHYFPSKGLGYSYNLNDVIAYYELYSDLMQLFQMVYGDNIYNLNYEQITTDQNYETRKLIQLLNLDWEDACLAPQEMNEVLERLLNCKLHKRSIKAAQRRGESMNHF